MAGFPVASGGGIALGSTQFGLASARPSASSVAAGFLYYATVLAASGILTYGYVSS